jgi:hypothetical protein
VRDANGIRKTSRFLFLILITRTSSLLNKLRLTVFGLLQSFQNCFLYRSICSSLKPSIFKIPFLSCTPITIIPVLVFAKAEYDFHNSLGKPSLPDLYSISKYSLGRNSSFNNEKIDCSSSISKRLNCLLVMINQFYIPRY